MNETAIVPEDADVQRVVRRPGKATGLGAGKLPCVREADHTANALTVALVAPGKDARRALRKADRLFDRVDQLAKAGLLPHGWRVVAGEREDTFEDTYVTARYDALSEALREDGGPVAARRALAVARVEWAHLDTCMCSGGPFPEPWRPRE